MPSLSGKNISSSIHLSGKNQALGSSSGQLPLEIKRLKTLILTQIFIPLISNQWETLYQNVLFLEPLKKKIHLFHSFSVWREELAIYSEILNLMEKVVSEHRQLEEIEKKMAGSSVTEDLVSLVYKTTAIRLKPEYEIYDVIFGKPQREKNEKYREEILQDIQKMLGLETITFLKIKDVVLKKYGDGRIG